MKNQHILRRFLYAWAGLCASWRSERSFRAHIIVAACALVLLCVMRPAPLWWALLLLACGLMTAVELVNTAVEKLADHLHPLHHETLGIVKDTLAGAVLVTCITATCIFIAFLYAEL